MARTVNGGLRDFNLSPRIVKPYVEAQFTAMQNFKFRCPCHKSGQWVDFIQPAPYPIGYVIERKIIKNQDGSYRYQIIKADLKTTLKTKTNPLP
ncbi:MAG: hypothetical protein MJK04_01310 [Psychrosphaera sp.]|nr:hypothetical protein [Psychrosphaera sp.]